MAVILNEKIWVWGGPTRQWGGSMDDDTLVKGARFFGAQNGLYVYGPHSDAVLELHRPLTRLVCQIGSNCRNPEAVAADTVAEAERLSALSLRFPNIVGAVVDDFDTGSEKFTAEKLAAIQGALRSHNPKLKLHVVTYTMKQHPGCDDLLPYLDVVTLWVWKQGELARLDEDFDRMRQEFPGKPILMGIFIHDYGETSKARPNAVLAAHLDACRRRIDAGQAHGIIILGDREIAKHPAEAAFVRDYLAKHFAARG